MKKLFIVILLSLLLVGFQRKEISQEADIATALTNGKTNDISNAITNDIITDIATVISKDEYSDIQNDLVYHDYGTGIELSDSSKLLIYNLNLNLNEETAIIYAINLTSNEITRLYDYKPNQDLSYTPASDGVYIIVAETSSGEIIDIAPDAFIETILDEHNNGFILLD